MGSGKAGVGCYQTPKTADFCLSDDWESTSWTEPQASPFFRCPHTSSGVPMCPLSSRHILSSWCADLFGGILQPKKKSSWAQESRSTQRGSVRWLNGWRGVCTVALLTSNEVLTNTTPPIIPVPGAALGNVKTPPAVMCPRTSDSNSLYTVRK